MHAGLPPKFFSHILFQQIIDGDVEPTLQDVTDSEAHAEIKQACTTQTLEEFRSVIIEGTYFKLAGWQNVNDFARKEKIIQGSILVILLNLVYMCVFRML